MDVKLLVQNEMIALREVHEEDRERFFYLQQDPYINRYIKVPPSDEFVEIFFQALQTVWKDEDQKWHGCAVRLLEEDLIIGLVFYSYRDKDSQIVEIGWKFHPDFEGKGYATQAAKLLMEYLPTQILVHKFVAHCDAENLASERIMQKLGMQKEGFFKSNFKFGKEWRDEFAYGLVCE